MTRVDIYLLTPNAAHRDLMVCRLVDKARRQGHHAYVLTQDHAAAQRLDDLLWTFSAGSFVPHALYDGTQAAPDATLPVLIGHQEPPAGWNDVLVSLLPEVPDFFSRFARVADFVGPDDDDRQRGRERFRHYRDRGYPLETHEL
jgi:DNA polymerase-3 subunit chi